MDDREAEWVMDMAQQVKCKEGVQGAHGGLILTSFKSSAGVQFYVVELVDYKTSRTFFKIRTAKKLDRVE